MAPDFMRWNVTDDKGRLFDLAVHADETYVHIAAGVLGSDDSTRLGMVALTMDEVRRLEAALLDMVNGFPPTPDPSLEDSRLVNRPRPCWGVEDADGDRLVAEIIAGGCVAFHVGSLRNGGSAILYPAQVNELIRCLNHITRHLATPPPKEPEQ